MSKLSPGPRRATAAVLCVAALLAPAPHIFAQTPPAGAQSERERAFRLYDDQQFTNALPLLEKLALENPSDAAVIERLGISIFANSLTLKDTEARRRERVRARATLLRAKELGAAGDLIEVVLAAVPPDGSEGGASFSRNAAANEAMREGEAAFARGDLDRALAAYERALKLDPKLYEAPLFAGDVFLKRKQWDEAARWYARAIALDPDRETAYRYWGNALLMQRKLTGARDKYVEAIIAEPYNDYVWRNGLFRWARESGVELSHPVVEPQREGAPVGESQVAATSGPKRHGEPADGSSAWAAYDVTRAAWKESRFSREYPRERAYRHTLREEVEALRAVAARVREQMKDGRVKQLAPALANLLRLDDEGLLDAHVLFARADEGIARDYQEYRRTNRDKLRRYLLEYVAPAGKQ